MTLNNVIRSRYADDKRKKLVLGSTNRVVWKSKSRFIA